MRKFSISDIESITGIKAHTIRIWEQRYDLFVSKRTETNIRYYDDKDLCFFLNISNLSDNGFKISEIAKMSESDMVEAISILSADNCNPCIHVYALTDATLNFDDQKFLETLSFCINTHGVKAAMTDTVFPFMRKIGLMWQTGAITPAHEHFASDLIKRKIICAIDDFPARRTAESRKFMLFLPETESHELGLLLANYIIRSHGHQVLYLGQGIPCEDLQLAAKTFDPEFCVTCLTSVVIDNDVNNVIEKIVDNLQGQTLVLSGPMVLSTMIYPRNNLIILQDLMEFSEYIQSQRLERIG